MLQITVIQEWSYAAEYSLIQQIFVCACGDKDTVLDVRNTVEGRRNYTCKITTAASSRKEKHMVLRELRMRGLDLLKKMAPELRWEE